MPSARLRSLDVNVEDQKSYRYAVFPAISWEYLIVTCEAIVIPSSNTRAGVLTAIAADTTGL